jgi:hypothetical protein
MCRASQLWTSILRSNPHYPRFFGKDKIGIRSNGLLAIGSDLTVGGAASAGDVARGG